MSENIGRGCSGGKRVAFGRVTGCGPKSALTIWLSFWKSTLTYFGSPDCSVKKNYGLNILHSFFSLTIIPTRPVSWRSHTPLFFFSPRPFDSEFIDKYRKSPIIIPIPVRDHATYASHRQKSKYNPPRPLQKRTGKKKETPKTEKKIVPN